MTKQEILDKFSDIDFVYNDSSKHETLSRMLDELLKEQEAVVRCKDCKHRGDRSKCIVAFVAEKQEMPYFFYDNRGEWFCADGEAKE